jgi:1-acyl-sn-glycerol-3-phosphate acyltransferase
VSDPIERFDMLAPPRRQKWYLRPLTWAMSYPEVWLRGARITKVGMDGLRPPYVLLCNHNAFLDFKVAVAAMFPTGRISSSPSTFHRPGEPPP